MRVIRAPEVLVSGAPASVRGLLATVMAPVPQLLAVMVQVRIWVRMP